jgi:hypothetical protein
MTEKAPITMYKCPGSFTGANRVKYDYQAAYDDIQKDNLASRGYFETLDEAIKDAGGKAFAPIKPRRKKKVGKSSSLPINGSKPAEVGSKVVEPIKQSAKTIEDVVEQVEEQITDNLDEHKDKIKDLLSIKPLKEVAEMIGVKWQTLSAFKRKHEL